MTIRYLSRIALIAATIAFSTASQAQVQLREGPKASPGIKLRDMGASQPKPAQKKQEPKAECKKEQIPIRDGYGKITHYVQIGACP